MSSQKYNMKNPAVKRILQEVKEMQNNPSDDYMSLPLEDNIFEWQFAIRGPQETEFEGGIYHGRIQLPPEYPFKPPAFLLLTPNGRFETQTKICLSISQYHPEHWQPSWSVRTALVALIAFMPTKANGAIGSLEFSKEERQALAIKSAATPPKFGNEERQKLINEIHEQMLKRAHSVQDSTVAASTPPPLDVANNLISTPKREDKCEQEKDPELHEDAVNFSHPLPSDTGVPANEAVPPVERVDVAAPAAESRAVSEAGIQRPTTRQQTSDDRGLTLLAIGLIVALAALLTKKFLKSYWPISF